MPPCPFKKPLGFLCNTVVLLLFSISVKNHFADDLALLSHQQQQMHDKTNRLTSEAKKLGLKINKAKRRY